MTPAPELWTAAARLLSGNRAVRVYGSHESVCYLTEAGPVIEVEAGLSDSETLHALLHESSHCRLHLGNFRVLPAGHRPRRSNVQFNAPEYIRGETQAERLAGQWMAAVPKYGTLEQRLAFLIMSRTSAQLAGITKSLDAMLAR